MSGWTSRLRATRAHLYRAGIGGLFVVSLAFGGCIDPPNAAPGRKERSAAKAGAKATAPSHGFNDDIAWRKFDEGLAEAKRSGRPLMLLVHASWCRSCKELKPAFQDGELKELSDRFVMVNVDQDEEPRSQSFAPDGTYIPRVVFVDPKAGTPDPSLLNERRSRNLYYYGPHDDIVGVMKKALARYGES